MDAEMLPTRSMNAYAVPKRHILVVDDDALVCETVTMILQMDGHHVDSAHSGAEALAAFEPGKFDLVFTDYFMPMMTGGELAAAIKTRSASQPIVMLTAYPEKLQSRDQRLTAIDLFIGKPFEISSLRSAITSFPSAERHSSAAS
jgi:CheY-like chemotaxis protein